MYSSIIDYDICLDYVYISCMLDLDILCVIFEFYYFDYKLIVVYLSYY